MRSFFILLYIFIFHLNAVAMVAGFDREDAKKRCKPPTTSEPLVYMNDFHWDYSLPEMTQRFDEIYQSGKRLDARAFYDATTEHFYLIRRDNDKIYRVKISESFISSVTRHIELALKNKYADFVFFPDMGHSHLYFSQEHWETHYAPSLSTDPMYALYEKMLNDPKMRALYHTAEQLRVKNKTTGNFYDDYLEFRFWHRNPVGDNNIPESLVIYKEPTSSANTVSSIHGHHLWSSGYNISSSKDGCFKYLDRNGNTLYFDISLYDLPQDPLKPVDDAF